MLAFSANQRSAFQQNCSKSILIDLYLIFAAEVLRDSNHINPNFIKKNENFENLIFMKVEGNFCGEGWLNKINN